MADSKTKAAFVLVTLIIMAIIIIIVSTGRAEETGNGLDQSALSIDNAKRITNLIDGTSIYGMVVYAQEYLVYTLYTESSN